MRTVILLTASALALSACAGTGGENRYNADLDRLSASCRDRGGILAPTGSQTGRPETDNVCKITGGPSERVAPR